MDLSSIQNYLAISTARHSHLCPRQVLGVRIGLAGVAHLGLEVPRSDKRLIVILESDGCFADGVSVVTGSSVGHRTLRIEDYGKIAATFADVVTGKALRIAPKVDVRDKAFLFAPTEKQHYQAMLQAYQIMPEEELLCIQPVDLHPSLEQIVSRPGVRAVCSRCGEEILNEREVVQAGVVLCRACAGMAYYEIEPERSFSLEKSALKEAGNGAKPLRPQPNDL